MLLQQKNIVYSTCQITLTKMLTCRLQILFNKFLEYRIPSMSKDVIPIYKSTMSKSNYIIIESEEELCYQKYNKYQQS